jgi:hypothetical protein
LLRRRKRWSAKVSYLRLSQLVNEKRQHSKACVELVQHRRLTSDVRDLEGIEIGNCLPSSCITEKSRGRNRLLRHIVPASPNNLHDNSQCCQLRRLEAFKKLGLSSSNLLDIFQSSCNICCPIQKQKSSSFELRVSS